MRAKEFSRRPTVEAFADLVDKEKQISANKAAPAKTAKPAGPPGFDYNAAAKMAGIKPVVPPDQQVGQDKQTTPALPDTTKSAAIAKDVNTNLVNKVGEVPTKGINTGVQQYGAATNTAADIGAASSTGGQIFNTPTGTVNKAAANNPNQTAQKQANPQWDPKFEAPPTNGSSTKSTPPPKTTGKPEPYADLKANMAKVKSADAAATAPSLGQPTAAQAQQDQQTEPEQDAGNPSLTTSAGSKPATGSSKPTGFLAGIAQGFKTGMGGREGETLASLAARKAAGGLGLNATSQAIGSLPKSGTTITDPKLGKLTVQQPDSKHPDMVPVKTQDGRIIYIDGKDL